MSDSLPAVKARLLDRAVARFERESRQRFRQTLVRPAVITVSRQAGSGGSWIANRLSELLGWQLWDREILDVMASQSSLHYQARMFESLDEQIQGEIDSLAYASLGGVSKHVYFYLLRRAILIIAQNDAVVLGRAAHLLLPGALRVGITASTDTRVRNLMREENLTESAARARVRSADQARDDFLREFADRLRHARPSREGQPEYDLLINTDDIAVEDAVSLVLSAARMKLGSRVRPLEEEAA